MSNTEVKRAATRAVARQQRGMTIIELMVVIAIIGMLATGVTIGVMGAMKRSRVDTARNEACVVRQTVLMFVMQNPSKCPSIEDLKSGNYLDNKKSTTDPWDQEWNIECNGDDIDVYSMGPEGSERIACEKKENDG